jgi:hypothetical protein
MHMATKPQTDSVTGRGGGKKGERFGRVDGRKEDTFDLDEGIVDVDTHRGDGRVGQGWREGRCKGFIGKWPWKGSDKLRLSWPRWRTGCVEELAADSASGTDTLPT